MKLTSDHVVDGLQSARNVLAIALCLIVGACSSTSGVVKTGSDAFSVTVSASPGRGGVPAARRMAYEQAGAECAAKHGEVQTVEETAKSPTWTEGMAIVTLNFRCVPKS